MNNKIIHMTILMLLLSLTAHEVHAAVSHEVEACEVCIHTHSNDGFNTEDTPQYLLLDLSFQLKTRAQLPPLKSNLQITADYIRGPPTFS